MSEQHWAEKAVEEIAGLYLPVADGYRPKDFKSRAVAIIKRHALESYEIKGTISAAAMKNLLKAVSRGKARVKRK